VLYIVQFSVLGPNERLGVNCQARYIVGQHLLDVFILVPRGRAPFGQHRDSGPLTGHNTLSISREFVLYSQPIRFVRLDSEHVQSDGKSMNRGLLVLDLPRGHDSWCQPK